MRGCGPDSQSTARQGAKGWTAAMEKFRPHDLTTSRPRGDRAGGSGTRWPPLPVELTDHHPDRMDQLDATVGAFLTVTPELAREQAAAAERKTFAARREGHELPPPHGVPVPVKDLNHVARFRATMGPAALTDQVPDLDDHVTARPRAGGSPTPGKTPRVRTPPLHREPSSAPARTPWDLNRSAGGSSGGTRQRRRRLDRIPASACGLRPVRHQTQPGQGEFGPHTARRDRKPARRLAAAALDA